MTGYQDIGISGYQDIRMSNIKISRYQDIKISGYQDIRISRYQEIKISGYQHIKISGYQDVRILRYQDIKVSGYQDIQSQIGNSFAFLHFKFWVFILNNQTFWSQNIWPPKPRISTHNCNLSEENSDLTNDLFGPKSPVMHTAAQLSPRLPLSPCSIFLLPFWWWVTTDQWKGSGHLQLLTLRYL